MSLHFPFGIVEGWRGADGPIRNASNLRLGAGSSHTAKRQSGPDQVRLFSNK
jgi:hypothetical protein